MGRDAGGAGRGTRISESGSGRGRIPVAGGGTSFGSQFTDDYRTLRDARSDFPVGSRVVLNYTTVNGTRQRTFTVSKIRRTISGAYRPLLSDEQGNLQSITSVTSRFPNARLFRRS